MKRFLLGLLCGLVLAALCGVILVFSLIRLSDRRPTVADNTVSWSYGSRAKSQRKLQ